MVFALLFQIFFIVCHGDVANGTRESPPTCERRSLNRQGTTCNDTVGALLHSDHSLIQLHGSRLEQRLERIEKRVWRIEQSMDLSILSDESAVTNVTQTCNPSTMTRRRRNSQMCSCRRRSGSSSGNRGLACIGNEMKERCAGDGEDPFGIVGAEGTDVHCCNGLERCFFGSNYTCLKQCPGPKHELIVDWVKFFPIDSGSVANSPSWEDHFDQCPDDKPDPSKWKYEIFGPNSKNSEAQTYTSEKENAFCEDGKLVLRALCKDGKKCKDVTCSPDGHCHSPHGALTSGSIETPFQFGFGRLTARIKIGGEQEGLVGKGMWPAFWSLGEDVFTNGWPSCGEIDIMEYSQPHKTNGQNAYFRNNPYTWKRQHWVTTETKVKTYPMDSEGYRVFTLEYARDERGHTHLKMWVTETYEETLDPHTKVNIEYPKPGMPHHMVEDFDHSFNGKKINAKLNVAIGGNLGGKGPYF